MKFVSTFIGSFYSQQTYRDLRTKPGLGLAYSFLLMLLMLCVTCIAYTPALSRTHEAVFVGEDGHLSMMDDVFMQIAEQTPEMVFEKHILATKVPGPHVIHLKTTSKGLTEEGDAITIDTSGKTSYANMQTPILLTANEIVTKQNTKIEIKTYKELGAQSSSEGPIEINAEIARQFATDASEVIKDNLSMFYLIIGVVILLCLGVALYVGRILLMLFLALAGMLIANILKTKMTFEDLMRFSAVSMTPVTVFATLAPLVGDRGIGTFLLFVLGLIMLAVSLYISRDEGAAA